MKGVERPLDMAKFLRIFPECSNLAKTLKSYHSGENVMRLATISTLQAQSKAATSTS
jgi:hypothetical protein